MIEAAGLTDRGCVRERNEDTFLIRGPRDAAEEAERGTLLLVADGMGGLGQGETASRLVADATAGGYFARRGDPLADLKATVEEANRRLFAYAAGEGGGRPMGSTLTALAVLDGRAIIVHVGDSRAYRYRGGVLERLTRDHSLVQEMADRGEIEEGSELYLRHRNVLTRGLGLREDVQADTVELGGLEAGDILLLSTDGLHEVVGAEELRAYLRRYGKRPEKLCRALVRRTLALGAPDNVTVVAARRRPDAG